MKSPKMLERHLPMLLNSLRAIYHRSSRARGAADVAFTSPLAEFAAGDLLSNVVSLQNAQICNDATILSSSPLTIRMPMQQWAYGFLVPINRDAVSNATRALVIQMHLLVRSGEIGIAVVDESLSNLITIEQFVDARIPIVTLTIQNPKKAKSIVLRTTSRDLLSPEVTVLGVTALSPGALRLIPRQHGLSFDLIVICSPPKTATQTIDSTIRAIHPSVQVRRVHYISGKEAAHQRRLIGTNPVNLDTARLNQAMEADRVRHEIELVRSLGGSIAVIVGTREPIDRAIASMFQSLPDLMPLYLQLYRASGPLLTRLLSEAIIKDWRDEQATNFGKEHRQAFGSRIAYLDHFFRDEFTAVTGMDILRQPLDRNAGYTVLSAPGLSVLVYRYEDIHRGLAAGLSALLNCANIALVATNVSPEKPYAGLYGEFRSAIKVPIDLCEAIYRSRYVRHFYSEVEIATFIAKWSRGNC